MLDPEALNCCLAAFCLFVGSLGREGVDGGRGSAGKGQERCGHCPRRRPRGAHVKTTHTQFSTQLPSKPEQVVHAHQGTSNTRQ